MPSVGFELTISAGERPQTFALDPPPLGQATSHTVCVYNLTLFFPTQRCSSYIFGLLVGHEWYILFLFENPEFLGSK